MCPKTSAKEEVLPSRLGNVGLLTPSIRTRPKKTVDLEMM